MPKSAQNRRNFLIKMATITTEFGKLSSNKTRTVYLKIRSGKTEKRINTHVKVSESEISPRTKKIKTFEKAMKVEKLRLDLETKINQMGIDALGVNVDAKHITSAIIKKEEEVDFFAFAKNWLAHTSIKGKKNYQCMLNTFSSFLGKESLLFSDLTYTLLKEFGNHLSLQRLRRFQQEPEYRTQKGRQSSRYQRPRILSSSPHFCHPIQKPDEVQQRRR